MASLFVCSTGVDWGGTKIPNKVPPIILDIKLRSLLTKEIVWMLHSAMQGRTFFEILDSTLVSSPASDAVSGILRTFQTFAIKVTFNLYY